MTEGSLAERECGILWEDCPKQYTCEKGKECWEDSDDGKKIIAEVRRWITEYNKGCFVPRSSETET